MRVASFLYLTYFTISCSLIPEINRPKAPVPENLPATNSSGAFSEKGYAANMHWREFYQGEELKTLIRMALDNNRNLRAAVINVAQIKAQYGIQKSRLFPSLDAQGSYTRQKVPPGGFGGGDFPGFIQEQYRAQLAVTSWELDLFGRIRSLSEAALQEFFATKAAKDSVKITLISQVATTYLRALAFKKLEKLAQKTVSSRERTVALTKSRFSAGVSSHLDLRQAQTLLETARVDAIAFKRMRLLEINALELLIGDTLKGEELKGDFDQAAMAMAKLPVNLDSRVLLKRPDIQEAEHMLKAANAEIGAARAAFFPSLSLTASAGKLSTETKDLFDESSNAWLFSPSIHLPIFTAGRNQKQLELSELRKEESVIRYEEAIQQAFKEASDALIANDFLYRQMKAQRSVLAAARKAYEISTLRYKTGVESFLNELEARRSWYSSQQALINQKLEYLTNLTVLYRVLGGGVN